MKNSLYSLGLRDMTPLVSFGSVSVFANAVPPTCVCVKVTTCISLNPLVLCGVQCSWLLTDCRYFSFPIEMSWKFFYLLSIFPFFWQLCLAPAELLLLYLAKWINMPRVRRGLSFQGQLPSINELPPRPLLGAVLLNATTTFSSCLAVFKYLLLF